MARITMQPSGKSIRCTDGDTVLLALERAGYALPNNCRAGACGECKVRVISGQFDQGMVLDMALSQEERKQGYGLMCMAKPISEELEIEWGTEDAKPKLFPPHDGALFVVVDKRGLAEHTLELRLRPVGQAIRYWPGQYVTLSQPEAGVPARAYSISNAPRSDGELVLYVAHVNEGVTSSWIHEQLAIGDSVRVSGAYGAFIGDPSVESPVLCLAAGTGVAPVFSLTEAALRRGFREPVFMLVSARTRRDVFGQGMMAWWKTKHRNFDYRITLTREGADGYLAGRIGVVLPHLFSSLSNYTIFTAGSPDFVDTSVKLVMSLGAQMEFIHTEGFFSQRGAALTSTVQSVLR